MKNHFYLDNSNIFLGAHTTCEAIEGNDAKMGLRIHFENLIQVVSADRIFTQKFLAGSIPTSSSGIWEKANAAGFRIEVLHRITDESGRKREQSVDESLHLAIINSALDDCAEAGTILILTGDGKPTHLGTSFPGQAERAIRLGWNIENWSWGMTRSEDWDRLAKKFPEKVQLKLLDPHYRVVTFIESGNYHRFGNPEDRYFLKGRFTERPK